MSRRRERGRATARAGLGAVALLALCGCASTPAPGAATGPASTSPSTSASTTSASTTSASTTSSSSAASTSPTSSSTPVRTLPPTSLPPTSPPPTTTPAPTAPPTSTTPPTAAPPATAPPATAPPTTFPAWPAGNGAPPRVEPGSADLPFLAATVASLVGRNRAISVTVRRDGEAVFGAAAGSTNSGAPATTATPFVLASVSKLITMLSLAQLVETERLSLAQPVPWGALGLAHDPAWDGVTVQDLLTHTSGMPVAQGSWLDLPGSCAIPLAEAISAPPRQHRGEWRYSNGNYCALGLVVEHLTGTSLAAAGHELVFAPLGIDDPHLVTDGVLPDDAPYTNGKLGVERLERLGGAGAWLGSSRAIAAVLDRVDAGDRVTLAFPAIMQDQYGWGHTGTVDGAKACAWVIEGGRTVLVGLVSGNDPQSGSELCDALVPALAIDLGIYEGEPVRVPR